MRYGISTHLYHDRRLERDHLAQIASYGFDTIELFATRSHFDYHNASAIAHLAEWLSETGLTLASVHAPIAESFTKGQWSGGLSNAVTDGVKRQQTVRESEAALQIARRIPFDVFAVHLGSPLAYSQPGDNNRGSAFRSADEICRLAEPFGIRVALEVIPNDLSSAAALVSMIEQDLNADQAGICLDFGHAHLMGDVADTIETAAEHVVATHVHDNKRHTDDHLVPYLGSINWDMALMTMQKIGYEGIYLMELANTSAPETVLDEARRARERFERTLAHS
jgi:sugar phosphate isomerase/epimerase